MNVQSSAIIILNVPVIIGVKPAMTGFAKAQPKKVKVPKQKIQLNRVNLRSLIESQNGKFVSVDYIKANGETRKLTGRLGVTKFLKGGSNNVMSPERPYLTVFDIQLLEYRTVNLSTVKAIRCDNKIFEIVDTELDLKAA